MQMRMGGAGGPMQRQMLRNPQFLMMQAYHRSVIGFGQALYRAAEQQPTVPAWFARAALSEMRRSTEEMEKYRVTAMREVQVPPQRQKMMDEHLVQVKTHLRQLEDLARSDRIASEEVKTHLQAIFEGCQGAGCSPKAGMYPGRRGGYPRMQGWDCRQMPPERAAMMEKMMRKMKDQDAELQGIVQEMERATGDRKLALVAEAVAKMVQQRADMTADMESMQNHMLHGRGQPLPPGHEMEPEDDDMGDDEGMEEE